MGEVLPLPNRGEVFLDPRGEGRSLRVSWHRQESMLVLSLWQLGQCRATFRLEAEQVPELIRALASGLADGFVEHRAAHEKLSRMAQAGPKPPRLGPEKPAPEKPAPAPPTLPVAVEPETLPVAVEPATLPVAVKPPTVPAVPAAPTVGLTTKIESDKPETPAADNDEPGGVAKPVFLAPPDPS
jgi:hypothetical protein